jgi:hypothetical protein
VIAVLLGWIFLDKQVTPRVIVAAVVIVAVAPIVSGRGRAATAEPGRNPRRAYSQITGAMNRNGRRWRPPDVSDPSQS